MLVEFGHFRSVYMIDIQCSSTGCLQSRSREQKLRNFDLLLWKLDLFFRFICLAWTTIYYLIIVGLIFGMRCDSMMNDCKTVRCD